MIRVHIMMYGTLVFVVAALLSCAPVGNGQPVSCLEDSHCREGYFCETSAYVCHECLSCSDLKRHLPTTPNTCIKSVRECGACLEGLVPDRLGDINCVPPTDKTSTSSSSGDSNTTIIWIGAGIFIALLFVAAVAVMYRYVCNQSWIKFNVDTNIGATLPTHVVASAPECPPPYSPPQPPGDHPHTDEETSHPLIKSYQPPFPAVESQDLQNVSVFNPPSYVRLNNGSRLPEMYNDVSNDVNDNYSPSAHEEDTTPSEWVPTNNSDVGALNVPDAQPQRGSAESGASAGDFSTALAIARNTDLIHPPPVTLRLQPLNGNEDANGNDEGAYTHHGGMPSRNARNGAGNVNVMNVNQIFNIIKPPI